jgi:hypothetical protein
MYEWLVSHDEGETWEGTGVIAQGEQGLQGETGPRGPEGPKGADGESIDSIVKTSTSGLVDTYTITYTDESTSTFDVTNGEKGPQGNGFYAMTEENIEELIQRLDEEQINVNRGTIIDVLLSEANGEHDYVTTQGLAQGLYDYFKGPDPNYYLIDGYLIGNIVCEFEGNPVNYVTYYEMYKLKGDDGGGYTAGDNISISNTLEISASDEKRKISESSSKMYLTGITDAPTETETAYKGVANTGVYATNGDLHLDGNISHNCTSYSMESTGSIIISYTSTRYINVDCNYEGYLDIYLNQNQNGPFDGVKEVICRINNIDSFNGYSVGIRVNYNNPATSIVTKLKNFYDLRLTSSTGFGLSSDKSMELVFTFWGINDVTFNGGENV